MQRVILICALLVLLLSTANPAQADFSDDLSFSHDVTFGLLVGFFSLAAPKYTGTLIGLMALYEGQTGFILIGLPLSYYDHAVIPKDVPVALTAQERKELKAKHFLITAFAGTMMMWSKEHKNRKKENPEVFTQEDSQFFITPYEDTWAINYHYKF